jgi:ribosomal protein L31
MKKSIHPDNYRHVVFEDLNNGTRILTRSTIATEEKTKWDDGKEYPLVKSAHLKQLSPILYWRRTHYGHRRSRR